MRRTCGGESKDLGARKKHGLNELSRREHDVLIIVSIFSFVDDKVIAVLMLYNKINGYEK